MKLILSNGYPYPYPEGLTEAQQEELSQAAPAYRLVIEGVVHFEQKDTTTVEFRDMDAFQTAKAITGWALWSGVILEAPTSAADGYNYPAIVVGNVAYCGWQLVEAKPPLAPPLTLPLFYVRDEDRDQDLLVRAEAKDVLTEWRSHYELADDAEPTYIGPVTLKLSGALAWEDITRLAMRFKPLPE